MASRSRDSWSEAIRRFTTPLPGSEPYENRRPIRVQQKYHGLHLRVFLERRFPHVDIDDWLHVIEAGRLERRGSKLNEGDPVAAGDVLDHIIPETVEPDVATDIAILHESESILVVSKPAPLPVHPCGRFNKNSLVSIIEGACPGLTLHVVHRLDADTTGLLLLAKRKDAARDLSRQFEQGSVEKVYLAHVHPAPSEDEFSLALALGSETRHAGMREVDAAMGKAARSDFRVLKRRGDGTAIIEVRPRTGRTHQIRLHLRAHGCPIIGDSAYGARAVTDGTFSGQGPGLRLHASRISLPSLIGGGPLQFEAPPPSWI